MNQIFNIPVPPVAARAAVTAAATTGGTPPVPVVPVFTTAQSAITFTAAPGLITAIWSLAQRLIGSAAASPWVAFGLALAVGLLIWWQSAPAEETGKARALAIIYAFINSLSLAAAALGLSKLGS